ncbi:MAG: pilus assembly protein PilM [Planctomycetales bacterium]|nr:pilus assembly protein PilM [Planctomycetales bacterium]
MISKTPVGFDPYRMWLEIKTPRRPPNPYELLMIEPGEVPPSEVEAAAARQRRSLSRFRSNGDANLLQSLGNEIDRARETLLNRDSKAQLDSSLRAEGVPVGRTNGNGRASHPSGPSSANACLSCGAGNEEFSKFCASCGSPLFRRCPQCEKENTLSVRFCVGCGHNLAAMDADRVQRIQEAIEQGWKLHDAFELTKAIAFVRAVEGAGDPLLKSPYSEAMRLAEQWTSELEQWKARDGVAVQRSAMLIETHRYAEVASVADEIPEPLRSAELKRLAADAAGKAQVTNALMKEIREAVAKDDALDILSRIENFLALHPTNDRVRAIGDQVREKIIRKAKRRLAKHAYDEALEKLWLIPPSMQDESVAKLIESATELAHLERAIRRAAVVDDNLIALGEKLCKLAPDNEHAKQMLERMNRRRPKRPSDSRLHLRDWATPPEASPFGCEVVWLAAPTAFAAQSQVSLETLHAHPGRFFVAIGLALQGVKKTATAINLLSGEKKAGLLGKLGALRGPKNKIAWGIDLGGSALKAVKLSFDAKTEEVHFEAAEHIPYPRLLGDPEAETRRGEMMEEALRELMSRHDLKDTVICANLPGQRVLGRFFQIPDTKKRKLTDAILYEMRHQIPVPLEELYYGYETTPVVADLGGDVHRVTVVAAKQWDAKNRMATFAAVELDPDVMQSDCLALHNFALAEGLIAGLPEESKKKKRDDEPPAEDREAIAIVDVGSDAVNIVVSTPRQVWFRTLATGGNTLTKSLVKQFNLTFRQAQKLKHAPAKAPRVYKYFAAVEGEYDELASELQRSFAAFAKDHPRCQITKLYLCGGGVEACGLLSRLRGIGLTDAVQE